MKLRKLNIASKVALLMCGVILLTILSFSYLSYSFTKRSIEKQYLQQLNTASKLYSDKLNNFFNNVKKTTVKIQSSTIIKQHNSIYSNYTNDQEDSINQIYQKNISSSLTFLQNSFDNIIIANPKGKILYSTNSSHIQQTPNNFFYGPSKNYIDSLIIKPLFSETYINEGIPCIAYGAPLTDLYDNPIAILIIQVKLKNIFQLIKDNQHIVSNIEVALGEKYKNKITIYNPLKKENNTKNNTIVELGKALAIPMQKAITGKKGHTKSWDHNKNMVLASYNAIPETNWGLVTKIDESKIQEQVLPLFIKYVVAGTIILLLAIGVGLILAHFITTPINSLKKTMQLLGQGLLPETVDKSTNDEIGDMALSLNSFVQALKRTANFAHKIGEGNYDAEFQPMSDNDTLGTALINMRDSIQDAEKKDKERNWIVIGVAEVGEILRLHDSLEELGDAVTAYVTDKINAIQGAFYVVNDEDPDNLFIEMKSCYAYHKKKYYKNSFKFAEGLVGQSAIEQDTLLRTEVPDDYVTITSGLLGDQRPSCILIVPLITNEQVYGVMEFAGFQKFNPTHVKFVEEISLITARTIFNIKVNERTRRLLSESQEMSAELQEKQQILQQNAEEMEATQEELKRTNNELERQIEEVNRTQKRMQLLLENASEVITIYEEDKKIRYISPSVEKILGYTQDERIGTSDINNVSEETAQHIQEMFDKLLENPEQSVTIQYEYHTKDGNNIWLESTGKNLLADPAIQGILVNSQDITERRRAEQEERMRTKMQSLSENSPDLITRFDDQGTFFYINPIIEALTGNTPEHFLNKTIQDVDLSETITQELATLLELVKKENKKITQEMDFPSNTLGDRIMQVNAIPEFDEEETIESVLVVAHDITERKKIELDIQNKNKKITESINYARRIQGAILPDNDIIRKNLPESFIFYKARDVVSGDFPWYLQIGDDIYIAAVDCTGHGVPGALISLIGYFLLNDIVRSRKINEPGKILDELDLGVTQTLRQDREGAETKDGMDIALCKINLKKGEVEYAGAHRPLYFLKQKGELEEIKGNRFPIGGGKYKNQTNFTNTTIKVKKGDTIFFCSDGFPDQFGGPNERKFGTKRLRELILNNKGKNVEEIHNNIATEWEEWKGTNKQTDDVLLIGIKF